LLKHAQQSNVLIQEAQNNELVIADLLEQKEKDLLSLQAQLAERDAIDHEIVKLKEQI